MSTTDTPIEWAAERAGADGEEHEHTLYFDPDDVNRLGLMQVWDEQGDDGLPYVGFFGHVMAGPHEFRWDLSPDQAIDLAAMLVVHAQNARGVALERAFESDV